MQGQDKSQQRQAAAERRDQIKREQAYGDGKLSKSEVLDVRAQYELLTTNEKRMTNNYRLDDLSRDEQLKLLFREVEELNGKLKVRMKKIKVILGMRPEVLPIPHQERPLILPMLRHYRSAGFERVTFIMLKKFLEAQITMNQGKPYKMNTSVTQLKAFLKQIGTTIGPRVYVSVGPASKEKHYWLEKGPIELYGGCADGEQRTHWIDLTKGMVTEEPEEA